MRDNIVVLNGGDTWNPMELIEKYPLVNSDWAVISEAKKNPKHWFFVADVASPKNDPWNRPMKKWTFGGLPIDDDFTWVKGYEPCPFTSEEWVDKNSDKLLGYTTIEGRPVKLWRKESE